MFTLPTLNLYLSPIRLSLIIALLTDSFILDYFYNSHAIAKRACQL